MFGIEQHQFRKFLRGTRGINRAFESRLYEARQAADVVEMRMGNENRVNFFRVIMERLKIFAFRIMASLMQPAITITFVPFDSKT